MEIRKVKISDLHPAPYNPRVELHKGDPEYEHIKNSIERFGYQDPIIWNEATGNVVGGHQRLQVLKDLGYEEVEVNVVWMEDLNREKAMNMALNKAIGLWDFPKMESLLDELQTDGWSMTDFGFQDSNVLDVDDFFSESEQKEKKSKTIICPHCGKEFEI